MKRIYSFFIKPKTYVDTYLSQQFEIDARVYPGNLLHELTKSRNLQKFIDEMNKKQKNGIKLLRKLCIIHLLLIHSIDLCQSFQRLKFKTISDDAWLNQNIITPYSHFLNKLCFSQQMYRKTKLDKTIEINFDTLFFVMKMLNDLFIVVKKMDSLARYYKEEADISVSMLINNFVCLNAFHAQQMYAVFKVILGQFIRFPKVYILTKETEQVMKYLLRDQLVIINQQIKTLFLDKYFFPLGKGFGVKLLRVQELPDDSRDFADSLIYSCLNRTRKTKKKNTLDSIIFDQTGKMNPEFLLSLRHITMGEMGQQQIINRIQQLPDEEIKGTERVRKPRNFIQNMQTV